MITSVTMRVGTGDECVTVYGDGDSLCLHGSREELIAFAERIKSEAARKSLPEIPSAPSA